MRTSVESQKLDSILFGKQIKNIIACEGGDVKERHEKVEKWIRRLQVTGFVKVPLSYNGSIEATNLFQ
jgi:hypothetical protein